MGRHADLEFLRSALKELEVAPLRLRLLSRQPGLGEKVIFVKWRKSSPASGIGIESERGSISYVLPDAEIFLHEEPPTETARPAWRLRMKQGINALSEVDTKPYRSLSDLLAKVYAVWQSEVDRLDEEAMISSVITKILFRLNEEVPE